MDSSSATTHLKTTIDLEKDQTFFRRNKRLIFISFFLILLLALILTTSILIRLIIINHTRESPNIVVLYSSHPAIESFCSVANNTLPCISSLYNLINSSPNHRPIDIYRISLRSSVIRLKELVPSLAENSLPETESVYINCSSSLADSMSQLNATLGILMETNPFKGRMINDDRRDGMMNGILGAEGNLRSCLDDLEKIESTGVNELRKKVQEIKLLASWNKDFLQRNVEVYKKFEKDTAIEHKHGAFVVNYENMFDICMVGSQFLFVFFLFLHLFRIR